MLRKLIWLATRELGKEGILGKELKDGFCS